MESKRRELLNRINRLSHDLSADHRSELRELNVEYNRIMDDMDNVSPNVGSDILDIFPSELWIQIVKDALPERGYSSALLLLTMVSNKWMRALISVPTLWTYIDLRGSQEDSLATIEAFKQLSGDISLKISIYVPTRHDIAVINDVLASVGPRLSEVTIRSDMERIFLPVAMSSVFSLLLRNPQYISSVVHIHVEIPGHHLLYATATDGIIGEANLPPLLRGLSGLPFSWRVFQQADNYLANVEEIESYGPLELVIADQIQLPRLKSLGIYQDLFPDSRFEFTAQKGLPRLGNLTSLAYKSAFREALIQLLTSVAPQLLSLELRIPHAKIPLLVPCLQVATRLRSLCVEVAEWNENDQGKNNITDRLVLPAILHNVPSLKNLELRVLHVGTKGLSEPDFTFKAPLLSSLIRSISLLYQNVDKLVFSTDPRYPTCTIDILSYLSRLKMLRRLRWQNYPEHTEAGKQPMMEMRTLEYLDTNNPNLLCSLRTPNLLSLGFSWRYHGEAENLRHDHVVKLQITYTKVGRSMLELPGDSFTSVVELTLDFRALSDEYGADEVVHGGLKLTSFQMLSSITIISYGFTPHETMLCFSLLCQPEECPALNEIKFQNSIPDWDALFFMLEKRNFVLDTRVSRIRRITLPFVPNELGAPLAALLAGRYTERPSNENLIMGGSQEIMFDETIPGCVKCLLDMRADCKEKVLIVGKDEIPPGYNQVYATSIKFRWQPDLEHAGADAATVEWIKQRSSLHQNFLRCFETWGEKYHRRSQCWTKESVMEITEYGVRVIRRSIL